MTEKPLRSRKAIESMIRAGVLACVIAVGVALLKTVVG
jgi:hypothetical protein